MENALQFWTAPENSLFTAALLLMLVITVLQLFGLGDWIDGDSDFDIDVNTDLGFLDGLLSFIGFGRLPFMMWLILFLALFGLIGVSGQQLIGALTGEYWSPWLAGLVAAGVTLPLTGALARPLARVLPHDETTAIDVRELIGLSGRITVGRATRGSPARARVTDFHGQDHYVMVEPDLENVTFHEGDTIRLVRMEGQVFRAITDGQAPVAWLEAL